MAANKRTKIQREHDLEQIAQLYCQGVKQTEIAARMGTTQQQVSYDLRVLQRRWLAASVASLDQRKAQELARIDHLEREYWTAWERSQKDAETHIEQSTPRGTISTDKTEGQSGNPAFLAGVQWCINKRCEILGLDAPKKQDLTSGGESIKVIGIGIDVDKL